MKGVDVLDLARPRYEQTIQGDRIELMAMLRQASLTIDNLWRAALSDGTDTSALQLGEASQGVHRALIALAACDPGR